MQIARQFLLDIMDAEPKQLKELAYYLNLYSAYVVGGASNKAMNNVIYKLNDALEKIVGVS